MPTSNTLLTLAAAALLLLACQRGGSDLLPNDLKEGATVVGNSLSDSRRRDKEKGVDETTNVEKAQEKHDVTSDQNSNTDQIGSITDKGKGQGADDVAHDLQVGKSKDNLKLPAPQPSLAPSPSSPGAEVTQVSDSGLLFRLITAHGCTTPMSEAFLDGTRWRRRDAPMEIAIGKSVGDWFAVSATTGETRSLMKSNDRSYPRFILVAGGEPELKERHCTDPEKSTALTESNLPRNVIRRSVSIFERGAHHRLVWYVSPGKGIPFVVHRFTVMPADRPPATFDLVAGSMGSSEEP